MASTTTPVRPSSGAPGWDRTLTVIATALAVLGVGLLWAVKAAWWLTVWTLKITLLLVIWTVIGLFAVLVFLLVGARAR